MSNILISLGSVIREDGLFKKIDQIPERTFFLVERKHNFLYKDLSESKKIFFERNILKSKKYSLSKNLNISKLYRITEEILKDQNAHLILSRRTLNHFEYSPMRLNDIAVNLINNSYSLILEKKLEYFIIHNTPHSENWFLYRTAELMGKKIFVIRESLIPTFSRFYKGLTDQRVVNWKGVKTKFPSKIVNDFIKEKTNKDYVFPGLQLERKKMYKNGYSGIISEARFFLKEDSFNLKRTIKSKLSVLKTLFFKKDSLDYYQNIVSIKNNNELNKYLPYVVFFLQYQPERTSIPEANSFSYQYRALLLLRNLLPVNINLLVKEHPDTYRNKFSPRFKSKESYINMKSIPKILFCDMNINPFLLVDNSVLVATLTGNVGIESICRRKKLIYFGNPIYKDYPYSINGINLKSKKDLKEFIDKDKDQSITNESIQKYITNFIRKSYKNNFENFSTNLLNNLLKNIEDL